MLPVLCVVVFFIAAVVGENIFGEQMFGGFFKNFGEKGFLNFPPEIVI